MKLIQTGPRNAKIVLVGEAPGRQEAERGLPFIGGSGELLNRALEKAGLSRSDCFITNVCHVRPPDNEFSWFLKQANLPILFHGIAQLKADIQDIKPNLVIAFGGQPLRFLTGKLGIEKWRGSILESNLITGQKVIGTFHPAYCLRIWDYKAVLDFDLARCSVECHDNAVVRPQRDLILDPPEHERDRLLPELMGAEWLSIDIECVERANGSWELSCVGFSDHASRAVVIPVRTAADRLYVQTLCGSDCKKVFQNGTFDVTVLGREGITVRNFAWDTMLAHHSLYTECASGEDEVSKLTRAYGKKKQQAAIQKGLAFQTSIYTKEPFYKDDGKVSVRTGDLHMFWRYNGLDASVTREIRDVQERELQDFEVGSVFEHEMSLVQPLMDATNTGILIDKEAHKRLLEKYKGEIVNLQAFLDATVGSAANAKSPKQMQELLYDKLKLPIKRNSRTGRPTADKDAINALAEKYPHPVLLSILEIRERRDIIERYLNTAYDADGRMRCSFDITGTRSGRLASRASIFGSGTNLQNQPEEIREMYVADSGCVFIYRDYSQAEARVVAYYAQAQALIELFSDPTRDVHKENASRIFTKAVEAITAEERYNAKRGIHAFNYGMEEDKFVRVVNQAFRDTGFRMSKDVARRVRNGYFLLYPEIRGVFWRDVERELRADRILVNAFGRKRTFYGRWDDKLVRDAYSYKPQSTVGDLTCMAVVRCHREIKEATLLLTVHDSILMQCRIEDVKVVAAKMASAMEIPIRIQGQSFTIPTDCKVGYNWGNRTETNPQGLVSLKEWSGSDK